MRSAYALMIRAKKDAMTARNVVKATAFEFAPSGAWFAASSTGSATQGCTLNECFSSQPRNVARIIASMTRMNSTSARPRDPGRPEPHSPAPFCGMKSSG